MQQNDRTLADGAGGPAGAGPGVRGKSKPIHSVGSSPDCLDKGLPVRAWRLRGLYAETRGRYRDKSDRVAPAPTPSTHTHTSHSLHHTAGACGGAGADGREPDGGRTLSSGALGNALGRGEGERIGRPIVHVAIIDYPNGNGPSHLGEQALGG